MKVHLICGAVLFGLAGLQTASASLVLETFQQFSGTGLGAVPTIVTFQANGQATTETGCIGLNSATGSALSGTGACTSGGDTKNGASQAQLQPLSAASIGTGATGAANFALVFNAVQPAGGPLGISNITAAFYNSTGTQLLYETSGFGCQTTSGGPIVSAGANGCLLTSTAQGTGNSGFVVVLDAAQQKAAVTAGAFSSSGNLVGVSSAAGTSAGPAAGGPETIFLGSLSGTTPIGGQVPEPGTCLLIASGLGLVGLTKKFRRA